MRRIHSHNEPPISRSHRGPHSSPYVEVERSGNNEIAHSKQRRKGGKGGGDIYCGHLLSGSLSYGRPDLELSTRRRRRTRGVQEERKGGFNDGLSHEFRETRGLPPPFGKDDNSILSPSSLPTRSWKTCINGFLCFSEAGGIFFSVRSGKQGDRTEPFPECR